MILTQTLNMAASKNLGRAAFRYLGKEMNYNEFRTWVARLSYLYLHEVGHSGRVAYLARNCPAYAATLFALSNIRVPSILMDPDRSPDEIAEWLKDSKATHLAVTSDLSAKAREILQHARISLPLLEIEKKHGGEYDPSFTAPPDNQPKDTDVVVILRTAGRTGKAKLTQFNHVQVTHAAQCLRGVYHLMPTDRFCAQANWSTPYSFLHGLMTPLLVGATSVIDHGAENKDYLDFLVESRVTRLLGTPPQFFKYLSICKAEKRQPMAGLKSVTVFQGSLSTELRKAFAMFKIPVVHAYGQAEAVWTLAMEDTEKAAESPSLVKGKVGRGLPGLKYKVLDAAGDEIPGKGEREGLLAVSGPSVMAGYLGRDVEQKAVMRGTWLYTGDYVRLEGDGDEMVMTFLGRKEDIIVEGSRIISSEPIDAVAKAVPGVLDAAGFVVANGKGELQFAVAVVKAPGTALNEAQVLAHCGGKLAGAGAPRLAVFTDAIPRDGGGNVLRSKLRAQYSGMTV